jgi:hypothetical protein
MIVLNLSCENSHVFEGWFASVEVFHAQAAGGQVECPHCQSAIIEKRPAVPHVRRALPDSTTRAVVKPSEDDIRRRNLMEELLRQSDNVGTRFPEEARKIHYSEIPARAIHGTATAAEVISLLEEDIGVIPLPNVLRNDIH